MGIFSNSEVILLKEDSDSKNYLGKLKELKERCFDSKLLIDKIDKEIAITEAGIYGEDSILFELI